MTTVEPIRYCISDGDDDCFASLVVRAWDKWCAVGGRLFMFTSVAGCIESFTAYQLQTCFGATSTRESNRTKITMGTTTGGGRAA